jgi:c-di-AMP phosphodiesterase-like protein
MRTNFRELFFYTSVVILALSIAALVYLTHDNWIVTTITTLTTVVGVFAVWLQMQKGKRLNEGEFILNLRRQFVDNPHIYQLTLKLEKYDRSDKINNPFSEDDISDIASYMTFFEVMYLLMKRSIIKLYMVDLLFSFHFFLLINNEKIQEIELIPCQDYYIDVYRLYYDWVNYRKEKKLPVYGEESNILDKLRPDIVKKIEKGGK